MSIHIDDIDRELIRILQGDGRTPFSQLGRVVGLSDAACRQRVMRLLEDGVIDIVAVTDPVKLGLGYQAMVAINVGGDIRKVALEIGTMDDAVYVVMTTGRYDLLVEVVVRDADALVDVSNTLRMMDGVRSIEVMSYIGLTKQTYDWGVG
ncbi:MAG: Lrp/AsnC family transcriptional regulator [Acidimicrobiia bacterium]|nr:Lrp/AsnC family transcriptional regulator [Acidimicrobiia bacterium]